MSAIFELGLLFYVSPFALFMVVEVISGIDTSLSTFKVPYRISKVNFALGKPLNPSTWFATILVSTDLGALAAGGSMTTQTPSPFLCKSLLDYKPNVFSYKLIFQFYYSIMKNKVPDSATPQHTDLPPTFSRIILHKVPLFMSEIKCMLS